MMVFKIDLLLDKWCHWDKKKKPKKQKNKQKINIYLKLKKSIIILNASSYPILMS
mgnify:CR=1 FL=1